MEERSVWFCVCLSVNNLKEIIHLIILKYASLIPTPVMKLAPPPSPHPPPLILLIPLTQSCILSLKDSSPCQGFSRPLNTSTTVIPCWGDLAFRLCHQPPWRFALAAVIQYLRLTGARGPHTQTAHRGEQGKRSTPQHRGPALKTLPGKGAQSSAGLPRLTSQGRRGTIALIGHNVQGLHQGYKGTQNLYATQPLTRRGQGSQPWSSSTPSGLSHGAQRVNLSSQS